jgi:predicted nucleic acid-binding protein
LQRVEAVFDPIPFDVEAARAYGRIHAAVVASGRRSRGRFADLLIASTALAGDLPLLTRNPDDFTGLAELVDVRTV